MGCISTAPVTSVRRTPLSRRCRTAARLATAAAFVVAHGTCGAQTGLLQSLGELTQSITKGASPAASQADAAAAGDAKPAAGRAPAGSVSASPAGASLARLEPTQAALNELRPDPHCQKVEERTDVFQKAADYAGTNAQLRLQTLLASDFQQSELSESDKKLLQYLAYTTIWIPSSIETRVGEAWSAFTSKGSDNPEKSQRTQRAALARLAERLEEVRLSIGEFPGSARLVLEPNLRDGALSRVGGMVVVSPRFLSLMDEQDGVRDVLLAHELSHLYKRHSLKELQYQLISTSAGWNVAKKLIGGRMPTSATGNSASIGAIFGSITGLVEAGRTVKELVDIIRETQTKYSVTQEFEADACALRWLQAMKVDPQSVWVTFAAVLQDPGPDAAASYASLHPSPKDRSVNVARALKQPIDLPPTGAGPKPSGTATKRKPAPPTVQSKN